MPHQSFYHGDRGDNSRGSSQATLAVTAMTAEKVHTTETSAEASGTSNNSHASEPENVVREKDLSAGEGLYASLHRFAGRFGVEERGIERVPRDERPNVGMSQVGLMWASANLVAPTFAIGVSAVPIFELGFSDAALAILLINFVGIGPVCIFAALGPKFGLRQIVLSRFYFGYYLVKLVAALNIVSVVGWVVLSTMVGAQIIHAMNPDIPPWASILVIAISTLVIALIGHRAVHVYECYTLVPCLIVFLVVLGQYARSGHFADVVTLTNGRERVVAALSFASALYGAGSGWCVFAADYTVYQPVHRSQASIYLWVFGCLYAPICFLELLGAAVATGILQDDGYLEAYGDGGVGGLLAHVLLPELGGFGAFCLVILMLSTIGNNAPVVYSIAFSLQALARRTQRVPRFIRSLGCTAVYVGISIAGYDSFAEWLANFVVIFGYWIGIYQAIALIEHLLFRRGTEGYRPDDYTNPEALPPGYTLLGAACFGVVGIVLGMSQDWYTGVVARVLGTAGRGADVGLLLGFGFGGVSYAVLRVVERLHFKR